MNNKNKSKHINKRDFNILLSLKGEIDLRTKSVSLQKKKYSRKIKHKNNMFKF